MTAEEREPWVLAHEKEKIRYQREMKEFRETGSFINKDGIRSKDLPKTKKVYKLNLPDNQQEDDLMYNQQAGLYHNTVPSDEPPESASSFSFGGAKKMTNTNKVVQPGKPKKAMGAYMFFVKAKYQELKERTDGSKSTHGISKQISQLWSQMTDEEK